MVELHAVALVQLRPLHQRQLVERQVDLDARAVADERGERGQEVGRHVMLVDEAEEGALGVDVREHDARGDLPAAVEDDAPDAAVERKDTLDRRVRADLGPCLPRRFRHHLGHATHASGHEAPLAHPAAGLVGGELVQHRVGRAGCGGTRDAVVDREPAQRRLDLVILETLVEVLGAGRSQEMERLQPEPAVAQRRRGHARQGPQVIERAHARVGRRHVEQPAEPARHLGELRLEALVGACVARREAGDLGLHGRQLVVHVEVGAVGKDVEARAGGYHVQAAFLHAHVVPDGLPHHRQHVGAGRSAEAGGELLRHRHAADERTTFEHQRAQAAARQVEGGGKAVRAAADDDGVVGSGRLSRHA